MSYAKLLVCPRNVRYDEYLAKRFFLKWYGVKMVYVHQDDFRADWDEIEDQRNQMQAWLLDEPTERFYLSGVRVFFESRADALRFKLVFG